MVTSAWMFKDNFIRIESHWMKETTKNMPSKGKMFWIFGLLLSNY